MTFLNIPLECKEKLFNGHYLLNAQQIAQRRHLYKKMKIPGAIRSIQEKYREQEYRK